MKLPSRRHARNILLVLALLSFAGWWGPSLFNAELYRRRLEAALERTLGRPVTFGSMSFRLLPHPGFSLENAVVLEDPNFGSEPFARVDRIDCDLRWRSLWHARLEIARLYLDHPSFNFVRDARGEWNVESLLRKRGRESSANARVPGEDDNSVGVLDLEASDARLNFKSGANKKPFALTDLRARIDLDPGWQRVRYRLAGRPVRTDLSFPSPGQVELAGEWIPGNDLEGPLAATLRTQGALLYDWIPLVTGHSPGLYGVLDAEIHLGGSIRLIQMDGEVRLGQLHRWESLPPAEPMSSTLYFRGTFDRRRGRAILDSLDASFADSRLHASGSVDKIPASPQVDLVLALERSRIEDLLALGRRLGGGTGSLGVSGRVDGLLTVQGSWAAWRYGGFVSARHVTLMTAGGTFPVSEIALRIDKTGARLAPVKIALAPRVELVAEGALYRAAPQGAGLPNSTSAHYELTFSAKTVPLRDLVRFGRAVGVHAAQNLDAQGSATATFRLIGPPWPLAPPELTGRIEVRAARLLVPGLTEPLNIPRARIEVKGNQVNADSVVAVIGTSVFTGRLKHQGRQQEPWRFDVRADKLSLEEAALWFDRLGYRQPLPLLERLPGLASFGARRAAASGLFSAVNAQGNFAAPAVTYRALTLRDFKASLEISGRVVRITGASFRAGAGGGRGQTRVDLTQSPARVTTDLTLTGVSLQNLAPRLPAVFQGVRGSASGTGHFETRGLTRREMSDNLQGQATLRLKNVFFGDFDPLDALVRQSRWGLPEPPRGEAGIRSALLNLQVRSRQVMLRSDSLEMAGARLTVAGSCGFDRAVDLDVYADLRRIARRSLDAPAESNSNGQQIHLHLSGTLDAMTVTPGPQVSRARP